MARTTLIRLAMAMGTMMKSEGLGSDGSWQLLARGQALLCNIAGWERFACFPDTRSVEFVDFGGQPRSGGIQSRVCGQRQ